MNIIPRLRKIGGYNILYLASGDPKNDVIILLHGIGASSERWLKLMPLLSRDFYVLAPDIIGFGYSDKPDASYTMEFFTDFVMNFIDSMGVIDKKITMIGSSLGGHIAAEFAIRYPNILSNLILVSPAGVMDHTTPALNDYILASMYPTVEHALKAFRNMTDEEHIDMNYVKSFVNRMRLPNAKYAFLASMMGSKISNLKGRLHMIKVRTLVIWGENDKILPVENAEEFRRANIKVIVMRSTGHIPFVDKPEEFYRLVIDFINKGYDHNRYRWK